MKGTGTKRHAACRKTSQRRGGLHWLAASLFMVSAASSVAVTEQDLYRVLEERSLGFDAEAVQESIIDGILRAVDQRARILGTNDAALIDAPAGIHTAETLNEDIYYLRIQNLAEGSGKEVVQKILDRTSGALAGVVLDLRGAGGNDLSSVDCIADLLAPTETPRYRVTGRDGQPLEDDAALTNRHVRISAPVMILVDAETSGASEVLAAILQGEESILIIGTQTRGHKGLMEVIPLTDSEFLYVSTRRVMLEKNGEAMGRGVIPDIVVDGQEEPDTDLPAPGKELEGKSLSEKARLDRDLMVRVAGDAALRSATDVLLGLKALGAAGQEPSAATNEVSRTAP